MKTRTKKAFSAVLSAAMLAGLANVPVFAADEAASLPTPIYSLDFSGYDANSEDSAKGITATGSAAAYDTITAYSQYITKGTQLYAPGQSFNYLTIAPENRIDGKDQYGVQIDFSQTIAGKELDNGDGTKVTKSGDMSVDFWMNIPGDKLTGKYARYFSLSGKSNMIFDLYNIADNRMKIDRGDNAGIYFYTNPTNSQHNKFNTWTHITATQSVEPKQVEVEKTITTTGEDGNETTTTTTETVTKYNYKTYVYANGKLISSKEEKLYDDWTAAVDKLILGINNQNAFVEGSDKNSDGKQNFSITGFNVYDAVLTADEAAAIYNATKAPYETVIADSLDYESIDVKNALTDNGEIRVKFNNYITENYSNKVILKKNGTAVDAAVTADDEELVIKPVNGGAFADGNYTIALSKDLTSFNGYTLGEDVEIPVKLDEGLEFALEIGENGALTDVSQSGNAVLNLGESVKINSFTNVNTDKIYYAEFEHNNGDENDNITATFNDAICTDETGSNPSDMTVEFWANFATIPATSDGKTPWSGTSEVFKLGSKSNMNNYNFRMINVPGHEHNGRFNIQPDDASGIYLGTVEKGAGVLDTWTHIIITRQYGEKGTTKVYVNGNEFLTKNEANYNKNLISKLNIGDIAGNDDTTNFKIASFNVYSGIHPELTANYEAEKNNFVAAPTDFNYKSLDTSKALTDGTINVDFDWKADEATTANAFTLTKDGKAVAIDSVTVNDSTVALKNNAGLAEGDYTLKILNSLKSVYGSALAEDVTVDFRIEDGLVLALDFSKAQDTDEEADDEGIRDLALNPGITIKSYAGFGVEEDTWGTQNKYLQLNDTDGSRVEIEFENPILAQTDGTNTYGSDAVTVEFWAKIKKHEVGTMSHTAVMFKMSNGNNPFMNMESVDEQRFGTDRWTVNPGNGANLYIAGHDSKVGEAWDEWAHFVITRTYEYDQENSNYKYKVQSYINGIKLDETTMNTTRVPAVKKIVLGDSSYSTETKLYSFNVYDSIKDNAWVTDRYITQKEIFEHKDYFENSNIYFNLDATSKNMLLTGATADIKIKPTADLNGKTYTVMIAGYNESGALVNVQQSEEQTVTSGKNEFTFNYTAGDNVASVKAFIWTDDLTPLATAEERATYTVALVGDSITHRTAYSRAIESYYTTRYPWLNVNIINKGSNADSFNGATDRFDWDILGGPVDNSGTIAELNGRPDAVTVMLGVNDIGHGNYADQNETTKESRVKTVLDGAERFIQKCIEEKLDLTIITPVVDDAKTADWTSTAFDLKNYGANEGLKRVTAGLKDLAVKYADKGINIGVADIWTQTTELTEKIRNVNASTKVIMNQDTDQVHPTTNGGFVMAYYFAKDNGEDGIVADVEINAAGNSIAKAENAKVSLTSASSSGVEYKYLANAIPMPVNSEYKYAEETLGLDVTGDLNKEIIKVTGLADGSYTITMDGTALSRTYTAAELAEGVNIATDANNPGQIAAMTAYESIEDKAEIEIYYRNLATDMRTFTGYKLDLMNYDTLLAAIKNRYDNWTGTDGDTRRTNEMNSLNRYYGIDTYDGMWVYAQHTNRATTWAKLNELATAAKTAAQPVEHTVVITAAAE